MKKSGMWLVFYKVAWVYVLSIFILVFPLYCIDWITNNNLVTYLWDSKAGAGALHLIGIIGVSWVIWDGHFTKDSRQEYMKSREEGKSQ